MNEQARKVAEIREELRVTMLEQPTTDYRDTFSDGYASGLATAIHTIDRQFNPAMKSVTEPVVVQERQAGGDDPINEVVSANYEAHPERWQNKPCAREHEPGLVCVRLDGHGTGSATE